MNLLTRNDISSFRPSSNALRWPAGMALIAQEPIATSLFAFFLIALSFLASPSVVIAPSTNATSRSASSLFLLRTLACLMSSRSFHLKKFSFISSTHTIVLSSQQVKENQPILSFLPIS